MGPQGPHCILLYYILPIYFKTQQLISTGRMWNDNNLFDIFTLVVWITAEHFKMTWFYLLYMYDRKFTLAPFWKCIEPTEKLVVLHIVSVTNYLFLFSPLHYTSVNTPTSTTATATTTTHSDNTLTSCVGIDRYNIFGSFK